MKQVHHYMWDPLRPQSAPCVSLINTILVKVIGGHYQPRHVGSTELLGIRSSPPKLSPSYRKALISSSARKHEDTLHTTLSWTRAFDVKIQALHRGQGCCVRHKVAYHLRVHTIASIWCRWDAPARGQSKLTCNVDPFSFMALNVPIKPGHITETKRSDASSDGSRSTANISTCDTGLSNIDFAIHIPGVYGTDPRVGPHRIRIAVCVPLPGQ